MSNVEEGKDWIEPLQLGTRGSDANSIHIKTLWSNLSIHLEELQTVLKAANIENFIDEMSHLFMGLQLDTKSTLKDAIGIDEEKISLRDLVIACANSKLTLVFSDGKIKYTKNNVDSVASVPLIILKGSVIQVTVDGDAELAEECIKRVALYLFSKASLDRTWPEIEKTIFCKAWRVCVEADLGVGIMDLLHPGFRRILDEEIQTNISSHGDILFDNHGNTVKHSKKLIMDSEINLGINIVDEQSGIVDRNSWEIDRSKTFHQGTTTMRFVGNCTFEALCQILIRISKELKNEHR